MRRQDWAFFLGVWAAVSAFGDLLVGHLFRAVVWASIAVFAGWMAQRWARLHPGPMPAILRWVLYLPRGAHSPANLMLLLQPKKGERIIEVGPGIGVHALRVAEAVGPEGVVEAIDVQQKMLDSLERRADLAGVRNIVTICGDATKLPHAEASFDAACLMTVLGEIPDPDAALRELHRVLRPGGRLVIGEFLIDPDFISFKRLQPLVSEAGFRFERRAGPWFEYLALFRADGRGSEAERQR